MVNGDIFFEKETDKVFDFLEALYRHLQTDYPKFFKMDKLSKLGLLAAELLLQQGFDKTAYTPEEVGIVLSNANSSLDADINYYNSVKNIPSPALFVYTLANIVIGEISIRHHFKGENAFFITPAPDATLLEFYTTDLFRHHGIKACITGWVEIVGEAYEAHLALIENKTGIDKQPFTAEAMTKLWQE